MHKIQNSPNERKKHFFKRCAILLGILLFYYIFNRVTKIGIPCIFHTITGLHCVGCGISRMLIALIHLDIQAAANANIYILCISPIALFIFVYKARRYIKYGILSDPQWLNCIYVVLLVLGVVFGILRNLPQFSFLAPHECRTF